MISSVANPRIKRVRRLRKAEWRERLGSVLIEGHHALGPALDAEVVQEVFATPGARGAATTDRALAAGIPVHEVSAEVMASLTSVATAPGVLAVARIVEALEHGRRGTLLVDVRDPAIEGALLALTVATGGTSAVVVRGCADPFSPKAMRAGAGAHYLARVVRDPGPAEAAVARARAAGATVFALTGDGPAPWTLELPDDLVLAVGSDALGAVADGTLGVPPAPVGPSLPLRAAAVLYEWVRQRGERGR